MEIHPDDSLGNGRAQLEQCQQGVIQMVQQFTNILTPMVPEIAVTAIPFLFNNNQEAWRVLKGSFGKELADVTLKKTGMRVLAWGEGCGFRNLYAKKQIRRPSDLKRTRDRVPEKPGHMAKIQAMGAKTLTITWAEIYTGMQSGTAEALDTELYSFFWKKLDEVTPHATMTLHGYNLHPLMINENFFQSLSDGHRRILLEGAELFQVVTDGMSRASEIKCIQDMEKKGFKLYYPTPAEREEWKKAGQKPYIDMIVKKTGQEWVDKIQKAVADVRREMNEEARAVHSGAQPATR
jgi:TRAP-type C4-dicarboxylate transport system substrate-binding protein